MYALSIFLFWRVTHEVEWKGTFGMIGRKKNYLNLQTIRTLTNKLNSLVAQTIDDHESAL